MSLKNFDRIHTIYETKAQVLSVWTPTATANQMFMSQVRPNDLSGGANSGIPGLFWSKVGTVTSVTSQTGFDGILTQASRFRSTYTYRSDVEASLTIFSSNAAAAQSFDVYFAMFPTYEGTAVSAFTGTFPNYEFPNLTLNPSLAFQNIKNMPHVRWRKITVQYGARTTAKLKTHMSIGKWIMGYPNATTAMLNISPSPGTVYVPPVGGQAVYCNWNFVVWGNVLGGSIQLACDFNMKYYTTALEPWLPLNLPEGRPERFRGTIVAPPTVLEPSESKEEEKPTIKVTEPKPRKFNPTPPISA